MGQLFITATGTGVGKTMVTALIARQLVARGKQPVALKPVVSGFDTAHPEDSDTGILMAATGQAVSDAALDRVSPWRFAAPLSPDMAARREERQVPFDTLTDFCRTQAASASGPLLVEGVGGVMAPLDDGHTVLDWITALDFPVLLVAGSYLGTISHTLTALEALEARGVTVSALALSTSAESPVSPWETAETLARFTAAPIRVIPRLTIGGNGVPDPAGAPDLSDLVSGA